MDRLISEKEVLDAISAWIALGDWDYTNATEYLRKRIKAIPSAEPKAGHCEECKHFHKLPYHADTLGKCFNHMGLCPKGDWYCADFEPQERSDKE